MSVFENEQLHLTIMTSKKIGIDDDNFNTAEQVVQ